ncbi:MAG TPA: prephenate dehydrogenase/arogenate dehydrogenase family protein [Thermoanaerobaculia bacterium]
MADPPDDAAADDAGPEASAELIELREAIAEVDRSLLELLHRRMDLAAAVGRLKAAEKAPIFVPEVHDRVLRRARRHADACGVSEQVMEAIFSAVMRGSIERQHQMAAEMRSTAGGRMLLVGGAGNMGGWFQGFARRVGHRVDVVDPAMIPLPAAGGRFGRFSDIADLDPYDAILVTVPLGVMPAVLAEVVAARPRGLVIEIASIKDHLQDVIARGLDLGVRVSSLHPMFGPGKSHYETLTFVLACHRDPQDEKQTIESWLRYPNTHVVSVPFDHHDRLMGWLLGLAHFSGMFFGCALTSSGLGAEELAACASTTYNRQLSTARSVLQEDPDLYFDIQSLNPHRGDVYRAAREALDQLVAAVQSGDRQRFRNLVGKASQFVCGA